jgi:hypothetical protein
LPPPLLLLLKLERIKSLVMVVVVNVAVVASVVSSSSMRLYMAAAEWVDDEDAIDLAVLFAQKAFDQLLLAQSSPLPSPAPSPQTALPLPVFARSGLFAAGTAEYPNHYPSYHRRRKCQT